MGAQSRSYLHSVPKVFTFTHRNKLTSRIVSKLLMGLTTLNQALIRTLTPNLMGVIRSELMISQAFQACYSIEGCSSDRCVLSYKRVGYMVGNIHQLNCKGNRGRKLQEIPQLIIIYGMWLQPTSRRFLRELDEAPGGNNLHYILQCLCVPVLVTRV